MGWKTLDDVDLNGKTVLTRVDINVPVKDGQVTDDTRIRAIVPTVLDIVKKGGRPVLLAHFGRPKGRYAPELSLKFAVPALEAALGRKVIFAPDGGAMKAAEYVSRMKPGDIVLLENIRFYPGEEANDPEFAKTLAALGDVFVMDAFSAAHRAHASTEGIAHLLPACAGRAMAAELDALGAALSDPLHPVVAIVGGSKVSTKIAVLKNLLGLVDHLVIGGGMANTFLAARGVDVGASLCERELKDTARAIEIAAKTSDCEIVLPVDGVVATALKAGVRTEIKPIDAIGPDQMILDIGPKTVDLINARLDGAGTLLWNGPTGAFEIEPFGRSTMAIAAHAAGLTASGQLISVAGGGDTVAALNAAGVTEDFTYVSTAGGAFLEWLEGKELPGVAALTSDT
ncbi:Phosphoglycerate kinase [hydrothermal vent metagenome]|uniref:phosphoglycerate kinase n=1 Tax=hydrothermal vent metagenome TaxID=652676 RepID=A0A3B0U2Q6_9ZZZZ